MKIIPKKKFAIRVKHYSGDYFTVEYANYRFFPIWHSFYWWFESKLMSDVENYSIKIFNSRKGAEDFAKSITSIEDVNKYHKKEKLKEKDFYKRKKEYLDSINFKTTIYKK